MKILRRIGLFLSISSILTATIVPQLTFEQIVAESGKIVHARVLDSRVENIDGLIWTHYRLQVIDSVKGTNDNIVVVSEPGGTLNGMTMTVQGATPFTSGEEDVLFLYQTPLGLWRTTGWSQGKFEVVNAPTGKSVRVAETGVELVPSARAAGRNIDAFNGQSLAAFLDTVRRQAGAN